MTITLNQPITIGGLTLKNRLVMAPMQQYKGTPEAYATEHHIQHYGRRARHVGLMILESTAVSADGRLVPNDIGIFTDQHVEPLREIVKAVHAHNTHIFIQLSHGGRKSSPEVTRTLVAPSAIPFDEVYGTPEALSIDEIQRLVDDYRLAARRSLEAGFDGIEIHAAHGFLVHEFLSPLSNKRHDHYGGSPENRTRFLREILTAIRGEVGQDYPVIIRVSATDYAEGGLTPASIAQMLKPFESELDAIDVSTGGLLPIQPKDVHTGYQLPHAAVFKQLLHMPVIAVGNLHSRSIADRILEDELADSIAIGRPLLSDPDYADTMLTPESLGI
ncbi:oxidoreductase [Paenibacillus guangzhouensis]|uniref:oxidoreductase n=1 Tax=Paenibacillus guangzhouensis TaxID=1473112 RepID=UPI0012674471|nr:NADH:flavin oxidoreductase [Paenibacillus guangzhouensis]